MPGGGRLAGLRPGTGQPGLRAECQDHPQRASAAWAARPQNPVSSARRTKPPAPSEDQPGATARVPDLLSSVSGRRPCAVARSRPAEGAVMLVAGVDSSTQSCKVVLCEAEDGTVVGRGSAPHPEGTEVDPAAWWTALQAAGHGLLDRADAIGVAGQQHGMVVLDEAGEVVRPALLWNDLRSADAAEELIAGRGGPGWWASHVGSVPGPSFTVTKLRWLATHEPASAARVRAVLLPHDWLTARLRSAGDDQVMPVPGTADLVTDRGDASGTGYYYPAENRWLPDVAAAAIGHEIMLPRVARPAEIVGRTPWGAALSAG